MAKPEFIWGSPIEGRGSCEVGKVSRCRTELNPQFGGCIAREVHRPCFSEDCVVKVFCAAIVGRGVWCSQFIRKTPNLLFVLFCAFFTFFKAKKVKIQKVQTT